MCWGYLHCDLGCYKSMLFLSILKLSSVPFANGSALLALFVLVWLAKRLLHQGCSWKNFHCEYLSRLHPGLEVLQAPEKNPLRKRGIQSLLKMGRRDLVGDKACLKRRQLAKFSCCHLKFHPLSG